METKDWEECEILNYEVTKYALKLKHITVYVHRHMLYKSTRLQTWYCSCPELGIKDDLLKSINYRSAKVEALSFILKLVKNLYTELKKELPM